MLLIGFQSFLSPTCTSCLVPYRGILSSIHCNPYKSFLLQHPSFHPLLSSLGIALAFGHEVAPHPDLVSIISRWAKTEDLSAPHYKMARVSKAARLRFGVDPSTGQKTNFPIVCVENVYAFPGWVSDGCEPKMGASHLQCT